MLGFPDPFAIFVLFGLFGFILLLIWPFYKVSEKIVSRSENNLSDPAVNNKVMIWTFALFVVALILYGSFKK